MIDYGFILLIIIQFFSNIVNIPLKFLKFIQTTTDTIKMALVHVFEEIRRTGEFTFTVTVLRKVHQELPEASPSPTATATASAQATAVPVLP